MALKQNKNATNALVQYLQTAGADEGADTVQALLKSLNDDLAHAEADADAARAAGNTTALSTCESSIHEIADSRAVLSEFLVQWAIDKAKNETDSLGADHTQVYRFSRFQADAKRLSASLETDPAQRQKALNEAMAMYKSLQSDQTWPLQSDDYQQNQTTKNKTDVNYPDPYITLGIGRSRSTSGLRQRP